MTQFSTDVINCIDCEVVKSRQSVFYVHFFTRQFSMLLRRYDILYNCLSNPAWIYATSKVNLVSFTTVKEIFSNAVNLHFWNCPWNVFKTRHAVLSYSCCVMRFHRYFLIRFPFGLSSFSILVLPVERSLNGQQWLCGYLKKLWTVTRAFDFSFVGLRSLNFTS